MTDTLDWLTGWPRTKPTERQWGNFRRKGGDSNHFAAVKAAYEAREAP